LQIDAVQGYNLSRHTLEQLNKPFAFGMDALIAPLNRPVTKRKRCDHE